MRPVVESPDELDRPLGGRHVPAGHEETLDAGGSRPRQDGRLLAREPLRVEVAVAVDQAHAKMLGARPIQRDQAPGLRWYSPISLPSVSVAAAYQPKPMSVFGVTIAPPLAFTAEIVASMSSTRR